MTYLLDTHILLWFFAGDAKLPEKAKEILEDDSVRCFVSLASLWEITIKLSLGKLQLGVPLSRFVELVNASGFEWLEIRPEHILQLESLPFFHRDPFDRLLIAQALSDAHTVISVDSEFANYPVKLIGDEGMNSVSNKSFGDL